MYDMLYRIIVMIGFIPFLYCAYFFLVRSSHRRFSQEVSSQFLCGCDFHNPTVSPIRLIQVGWYYGVGVFRVRSNLFDDLEIV